jgi:hypothetical protein
MVYCVCVGLLKHAATIDECIKLTNSLKINYHSKADAAAASELFRDRKNVGKVCIKIMNNHCQRVTELDV